MRAQISRNVSNNIERTDEHKHIVYCAHAVWAARWVRSHGTLCEHNHRINRPSGAVPHAIVSLTLYFYLCILFERKKKIDFVCLCGQQTMWCPLDVRPNMSSERDGNTFFCRKGSARDVLQCVNCRNNFRFLTKCTNTNTSKSSDDYSYLFGLYDP